MECDCEARLRDIAQTAAAAHTLAGACHTAIFGSGNGAATPEAVSTSISVRLAHLEIQVSSVRADIETVRRVAAQLQAAGAIVGAAVVGLQLVTLVLKLGG